MEYFRINNNSFSELQGKYDEHLNTLSEIIYNEFTGKHFTISEIKNKISNINFLNPDFNNIEKKVKTVSNNCISASDINNNCCLARVKHDEIFKQCTRKIKKGELVCGIHLKNKDNLPYGLITEEFTYKIEKKLRGRPKKNY